MSHMPLREKVKMFNANPWVTLTLAILAFAGAVFAIYTWIEGKSYPALKYAVPKSRTTVVDSGRTSNLQVSFGDRKIESNITAALLVLWNEGKTPIRSENILEPIYIRTGNNSPVLEAVVRKSSRELCKVQLDQSRTGEGIVGINWKILERNDAAVIQLIYEGDATTPIEMIGTVEGQPNIREVPFLENRAPRLSSLGLGLLLVITFSVLFGLFADSSGLVLKLMPERWRRTYKVLRVIFFVGIVVFLIIGLGPLFFPQVPPISPD